MLHVNNTTVLNTQINAVNVADLAIQTNVATVVATRYHHSESGMSSLGVYSGSTGRLYLLSGLLKRLFSHCCVCLKRSWQRDFNSEPMRTPGMLLMPVQPVIVRQPARSLSDY
jgi:hypothetical protein